jgi:hypothetical protein
MKRRKKGERTIAGMMRATLTTVKKKHNKATTTMARSVAKQTDADNDTYNDNEQRQRTTTPTTTNQVSQGKYFF